MAQPWSLDRRIGQVDDQADEQKHHDEAADHDLAEA
jgi:hypothetical protein